MHWKYLTDFTFFEVRKEKEPIPEPEYMPELFANGSGAKRDPVPSIDEFSRDEDSLDTQNFVADQKFESE